MFCKCLTADPMGHTNVGTQGDGKVVHVLEVPCGCAAALANAIDQSQP